MSLKYSKIMVPALALALNLSLYAQESYTTHTKSLKEAIENIAKQANLPYIADGKLLENKSTKPITNITNLQSALDEVLEGSNLKAVIQEGTILIVEKERNLSNTTLEVIDFVVRTNDGTAEDGYVVKELKQVGPWGEKSLQDTPYSMTVMPQELIENSIAGDMDQLYKMNPIIQNSTPMSVDGYPIAVFRGFTNDIGIIDGIRLSSNSRGIAMEELERVEIINGLTGFMYGVSGGEGIGGTTNYVLKRPTYQQLTNLTIGNYGGEQYFAHLDLGDKLDEKGKFAYRLNVSYQDGETSKDDQNVEKKLISGAIDWNVTDNFQLQLEAAHKFWRIDRPDNRFYTQGFTDWPEAYDNEKTFSPDWTYNQTKTDRVGLNATWNINDIFTLRTAYMYKKDNREFIIIYPILTPSGWTMYKPSKTAPYDTISHSAYTYLDSKFDTGNISHKLTFGISGDTYKERKYANSNVYDINPSYVTPSGLTEDELMNLASPNFSSDYGSKYKANETTSKNIIIGDDITFNDQWSALVGFNHTTIDNKVFNTAGIETSSYDKSELTPTLSLIYKPLKDLTTYASYIEGLEKGSTVPDDTSLYNNPGEILDPYISTQYEVGAKYSISENLLLSSALFRIEKANSYEETTSNGKKTINQDGLEIHQGLELTVTGKVTDNLTVITGGTLMDLSIDKASNKTLEGKKPTGSASTLAKIYAEYIVPEINGLTITGGAYYTGSKYKDSANLQKIDDYTIFNAGLRYKTKISKYPTIFNFNVTNLTGEDYWATTWQLGIPRNIAFSMKIEL